MIRIVTRPGAQRISNYRTSSIAFNFYSYESTIIAIIHRECDRPRRLCIVLFPFSMRFDIGNKKKNVRRYRRDEMAGRAAFSNARVPFVTPEPRVPTIIVRTSIFSPMTKLLSFSMYAIPISFFSPNGPLIRHT